MVADSIQSNPAISVILSESKPIIFLSICVPGFKDREVGNLESA